MSPRVDWEAIRAYAAKLSPPLKRKDVSVQHEGRRLTRLGPFTCSDSYVENWTLHEILVRQEGVELAFEGRIGKVRFFIGNPDQEHHSGPFDLGELTISYLQTECPYEAFSGAGDAVHDRIEKECGGSSPVEYFQAWFQEGEDEPASTEPVEHPALFFDPSGWVAIDLGHSSASPAILPEQIESLFRSVRPGRIPKANIRGGALLSYSGLETLVAKLKSQGFEQIVLHSDGQGWRSEYAQSLSDVHWDLELSADGLNDSMKECIEDLSQTGAKLRLQNRLTKNAVVEAPQLVESLGALRAAKGLVLNLCLPKGSDDWSDLRGDLAGLIENLEPQATDLGIDLVTGGDGEIPPCFLGSSLSMSISLWHDEAMDLQDDALHLDRACATCSLRRWCPGLPTPSTEGAGELEAFSPEDVPPHPMLGQAGADWEDGIRDALLGKAEVGIPLEDLLPSELVPNWPCVLPWTRLELSTQKTFGPCCVDFQQSPEAMGNPSEIEEHWNSPTMVAFRSSLTGRSSVSTCRESCPHLAGGTQLPNRLMLRGGSREFVENQIQLVHSLIRGDVELDCSPMELCITPTTYCNYDCLMCEWGEIGTLDDAYGPAFYEALNSLLPSLHLIEAAGGEPLAAPAFRDFLAEVDFHRFPQLQISLTTNGSYLTPREQERMAQVRFSNLTISMNAATADTYMKVNRGLEFARVRANLDALLQRKRAGLFGGSLVYSMVLLKENFHEISAFAELAREDDVMFRFMLPMHNRNNQSILTDKGMMEEALASLEAVARDERASGRIQRARWVLGEARVLRARLDAGLFAPLPDL